MTEQAIENVVTRKPVKLPAALSATMNVSQGFVAPDTDRLRIVVTGRPGCGKTSLFASNPKSLLFDLERNSGTVIDPACTRVEIRANTTTAADDFRKAMSAVIASYRTDAEFRESISRVDIDSFDALVEMFLRDLCVKNKIEDAGEYNGGHGKGYARVREELFGFLNSLSQVGLGWGLTAHLSLKDVNGTMVPCLNVSDSFKQQLLRSRDLMFKMECAPGAVQQKTKSGSTYNVTSKDPKDRRYVLITDTSTTSEDFDSPKSNVPIESGLLIPAKGGWAAFRAAYQKAVDIRRADAVQ